MKFPISCQRAGTLLLSVLNEELMEGSQAWQTQLPPNLLTTVMKTEAAKHLTSDKDSASAVKIVSQQLISKVRRKVRSSGKFVQSPSWFFSKSDRYSMVHGRLLAGFGFWRSLAEYVPYVVL